MNAVGAENRAGFMLLAAGYDLRNPCLSIVAEHRHCAAKTHARSIGTTARMATRNKVEPKVGLPRKGGCRFRDGGGAAAARVDMPVSSQVFSHFAANAAR